MSVVTLDTQQLLNKAGDCHYANGEDLHKTEGLFGTGGQKLKRQIILRNGETGEEEII